MTTETTPRTAIKRYILGVDPGVHGAMCLFDGDADSREDSALIIEDMPTFEITRNGKRRSQIDLYALARWIDEHSTQIQQAYIENPQGMPGMASNATYRLGLNCGIAQMAIASAFIPMVLLAPNSWKKKMELTKDKDSCRLRASQLRPHHAHLWARAKDDGRAEAALIAYHGWKQFYRAGE